MSYSRTIWQTGDKITKDKLNNIEEGIENTNIIAQLLSDNIEQTEENASNIAQNDEQIQQNKAYATNLTDCCLYIANNSIDSMYTKDKIFIEDGATAISHGRYSGAKMLQKLSLPNTITTIEDNAFYGNTSLKSVAAASPCSVTTIGDSAFEGCTSLKLFSLGTVTTIGANAFFRCVNLDTIHLNKASSIGANAFNGCESLEKVNFPDATYVGANAFNGTKWLSEQRKENPLVTLGKVLIDGTTCSGSVTIPDNVTTVGCGAFYSNYSLTGITIPGNITTIEDEAFYDCRGIRGILEIPNGVTTLGDNSFAQCINVEKLILPSTIETVGEGAFTGMTRVSSLELGQDFNAEADLSPFVQLTSAQWQTIFESLKDLIDEDTKVLTLGSTILSKLTDEIIQIATDKNWDLA